MVIRRKYIPSPALELLGYSYSIHFARLNQAISPEQSANSLPAESSLRFVFDDALFPRQPRPYQTRMSLL
jgi:hypothetical protein